MCYPSFQDTADTLRAFGAVLDAIQIVPVSIGFGLQIAALDTLDEAAQTFRQSVYK